MIPASVKKTATSLASARHPAYPSSGAPLYPRSTPRHMPSIKGGAAEQQRASHDDQQAFSQLLNASEQPAPLPALLWQPDMFSSTTLLPVSTETVPQSGNASFMLLEPQLVQGITQQETLPAEFSLLLPAMGEVSARLSASAQGALDIALGFSAPVLARLQGYEQEGQRSLSRRLGKSVHLRFKLREAL